MNRNNTSIKFFQIQGRNHFTRWDDDGRMKYLLRNTITDVYDYIEITYED